MFLEQQISMMNDFWRTLKIGVMMQKIQHCITGIFYHMNTWDFFKKKNNNLNGTDPKLLKNCIGLICVFSYKKDKAY